MKQVVLCGNPPCNRVTKRAGSFIAALEVPLTVKGIDTGETVKKTIHLCRGCAKEAGYKT